MPAHNACFCWRVQRVHFILRTTEGEGDLQGGERGKTASGGAPSTKEAERLRQNFQLCWVLLPLPPSAVP